MQKKFNVLLLALALFLLPQTAQAAELQSGPLNPDFVAYQEAMVIKVPGEPISLRLQVPRNWLRSRPMRPLPTPVLK